MRKYELATSLHFRYDTTCQTPIIREIERLHNCGFQNFDFNFLDMCIHPNSDFLKDSYLDWLRDCRAFGDQLGVKFVQAHAPCESVYDKHSYELLTTLCRKAIRGCAVLGIPWMAYHRTTADRFGLTGDDMDFNLKFFRELLPLAEECGVGIAIEDTLPFFPSRSAASATDDLIELVDRLDSEYVGVCWDVGHAHLAHVIEGAEELAHQSLQLKKLGDRLKCTHIHDNNSLRVSSCFKLAPEEAGRAIGAFDEHIAPFAGDIDWQDVIDGLDAIDYSHYFTFEAHHAANTLPEEAVDSGLTQLFCIGQALLNMSRL